MKNISKIRIDLLNGCETNSINYEGVVGIKGDKIFRNGQVIDTLDSDDKVDTIWDEYASNEGLT